MLHNLLGRQAVGFQFLMDPINARHIFRPEYSFADYGRSRDDSPGAPTVYMPSPVSGIVDPPKYSPATKMLPDASSVECKLQRGNSVPPDKSGTVTSASIRRLLHICLVYASRGLGLVAGLLTCVVGMSRLYQQSVTLRWPESGRFFSDATNSNTWRHQLFTLHPDILFDLWTPLIFGIASILAHLRWFEICSMTKTFWHSSMWNLLQALWANLGYCGGLGIVVGGVSLAAAFINVLTACLNLHAKASCICNSPTQLSYAPQPQRVYREKGMQENAFCKTVRIDGRYDPSTLWTILHTFHLNASPKNVDVHPLWPVGVT